MEIDIFDLLLSQTVPETVEEIVNFANMSSVDDLHVSILQLLVDLSEKEFSVTNEHLEAFEDKKSSQELIHSIFRSGMKTDQVILEIQSQFFKQFIAKAFINNFLSVELLKLIFTFLEVSVTHLRIPNNSTYRMNCFLTFKNLLNPIAVLNNSEGKENEDIPENLEEELKNSLQIILTNIPDALQFKKISAEVSKTFTNVVENRANIFLIDDCKIFDTFYKMMTTEDNFLQMTAIKSLKVLTQANTDNQMILNFVTDQSNIRGKSVSDVISELLTRRPLKGEIINLLRTLHEIDPDRGVFNQDLKLEIYSNIFTNLKKLVQQVVDLINELEEDFWMIAIDLMSSNLNFNMSVFMESIVKYEGVELTSELLIELLKKTSENPNKQKIVAKMYAEYLKTDLNAIGIVDDIVSVCKDEVTVGLIFQGFGIINEKNFNDYLSNNIEKVEPIIGCLIKSFDEHDDIFLLSVLVKILKMISKISPDAVQQQCRVNFLKNSKLARDSFSNNSEDIKIIKKLTVMMENHTLNLMSPQDLNLLYDVLIVTITKKVNSEANCSIYLRCLTNLIKCMWTKLVLGHSIGVKIPRLIEDVKAFVDLLRQEIFSEQLDHLPVDEILSFLDLLVFFQPSMDERYPNSIFSRLQITTSKDETKKLATILENFLFIAKSSESTIQYKKLLLNKWTAMFLNLNGMTSDTSSQRIIRHYNNTTEYKTELEALMKCFILKPQMLEKNVSFAVLNISHDDGATRKFKSFFQSFDEFLTRVDPKEKFLKLFLISTNILKKLSVHIESTESENRLIILDFVKIIIDGFEVRFKVKLKEFLSINATNLKLSAKEQIKLQTFISELEVE